MIKNLLVNLLDHDLEGLIAIASAETVEVEVEELDLCLLRELVDLADVLGRDAHFAWSVVSEQVDDLARPVVVQYILEMESERLLRHLGIPSQEDILSQTALLPEDGHRSPNLHMADQETARDDHDLLSLAEVRHIAHVIDASSVVSCASAVPHSARNQRQLHLYPVQRASSLCKVALDERREPATVDLLPDKVAIERQIPEVLMIACNQLQWVRALLLHPSHSTLARCGQIITIREVKAIFEVFLDILNYLQSLLGYS